MIPPYQSELPENKVKSCGTCTLYHNSGLNIVHIGLGIAVESTDTQVLSETWLLKTNNFLWSVEELMCTIDKPSYA